MGREKKRQADNEKKALSLGGYRMILLSLFAPAQVTSHKSPLPLELKIVSLSFTVFCPFYTPF